MGRWSSPLFYTYLMRRWELFVVFVEVTNFIASKCWLSTSHAFLQRTSIITLWGQLSWLCAKKKLCLFSVPYHLCAKKFTTSVSLKKNILLWNTQKVVLPWCNFWMNPTVRVNSQKQVALKEEETEEYFNGLRSWWSELMDHWYQITQVNNLLCSGTCICVAWTYTYLFFSLSSPMENGAVLTVLKYCKSTLSTCFVI